MTWCPPSPADKLADAGRVLHGEHWRMSLARDLGISDETLRRWITGRTPLGPDHGALDDALTLLQRRACEIGAAAEALRTWLKAARG